MKIDLFQGAKIAHNSSFGTEQGLLRLLRTQPHRKYQSHVHNSLLRTHQFVLVPKLPLHVKVGPFAAPLKWCDVMLPRTI